MYWINIGAVFIGGLNIGLALLVYLRNPKNKINITFAVAALCVGLWAAGEAIFRETETIEQAFFWARFENVFGSLIPVFFFLFTFYFPYQHKNFSSLAILAVSVSTILMLFIIIFSPWFLVNVFLEYPRNDFNLHLFGRTYYTIFIIFYVLFGYYLLFKKYFETGGIFRKNILTIILGTCSIGGFGAFFGIIGPLLNGRDNYWFASYFSLPMVIICAWFTLFNGKRVLIR